VERVNNGSGIGKKQITIIFMKVDAGCVPISHYILVADSNIVINIRFIGIKFGEFILLQEINFQDYRRTSDCCIKICLSSSLRIY